MDTLVVRLGESLLQVRGRMLFLRKEQPISAALQPIAFVSKNLPSTETHYSKIERETLGMLHGLEKFHHCCFANEGT